MNEDTFVSQCDRYYYRSRYKVNLKDYRRGSGKAFGKNWFLSSDSTWHKPREDAEAEEQRSRQKRTTSAEVLKHQRPRQIRELKVVHNCWSVEVFSHSVVSNALWPHGLQHARIPCSSPSLGVCLNSCPLSWWSHPTISFPVVPFSSCLWSCLASGSFPMSWLLESGGQSIRASASVLPMNIQDWFPSGLTSLISLLSKGLLIVFSSITIWRHQFFSTQPFLLSNSHIHTWLLEKP